jgi:hypothetical protein
MVYVVEEYDMVQTCTSNCFDFMVWRKYTEYVLFQVQEFEDKDTALLIDRYKYLDLYPCSQTELKAIGYYVSILCIFFIPWNQNSLRGQNRQVFSLSTKTQNSKEKYLTVYMID